jgi:hypothetical protein
MKTALLGGFGVSALPSQAAASLTTLRLRGLQ